MRTVIVAEKPSVARDIARVLGVRSRGDGFFASDAYVVTWAIGHLVSLCEPDEIDPAYKKWRADMLPILPETIPTKVLPKTKSQFAIVKRLLNDKDTQSVVCATDAGREGELIFRYIYEKAGCKKPVSRLWISSMTDAAIREGFARLAPDAAYDPLFVSARCRSEADWLIGMNASRAFTLRYDALLSIGRVQTPTLRLIVERDRAIRAFVPEEYYELRAHFGDYEGVWFNPEKKEAKLKDKAECEALRKAVTGKTGTVTQAQREKKLTPPPQLFDLTALQREMNRLFGYSAAKTLEIAQALYERHKLLTYPRTDSRYLPRDMIPKIQKVVSSLPAPYDAFAAPLLPSPPVTGRVYNDEKVSDHHAIVPTGQRADTGKLKEEERRVYDQVIRRLLTALYPAYEYESALIVTKVENCHFKSSGQTPVKEGWRALYRDEKKDADAELPNVKVGDTRIVQKTSLKKLKTKPPSPHTDASLLGMMEKAGRDLPDEELKERMKDSGLGTPATRAAIIERLIQVGYVARKGKILSATPKGERLIDVVPQEIASAETTGRWEKALGDMAKTREAEKLSALEKRFIEGIRRYAAFLVEAAKTAPSVTFDAEPRGKGKKRVTSLGVKCPLCGTGDVTANERAFGCSRYKEGCKYTVWRDGLTRQGGPVLTVPMMKKLFAGAALAVDGGEIRMENGRVVFTRSARP